MKLRSSLLIALTTALICSCCKEESVSNQFCENYRPAAISVGFNPDVTLDQAFELINSNGGAIQEMFSAVFVSDLSGDSIDYVRNYLNTKSYIKTNSFSAYVFIHYQTGALMFVATFWNMSIADQNDWFETMESLKLQEQSSAKSFLLGVPPGMEKNYVRIYSLTPGVKYAELDCLVKVRPD